MLKVLKENMATLLDVISKQMDRIFPIGSYFCAETATNPSVLLGFGTWEQLKDRMLIGVGDSFALSSVGGEINHTLTNAEMPSHTHTRGTMNITGTSGNPTTLTNYEEAGTPTGAFYVHAHGSSYGNTNGTYNRWSLGFDASRSWSGETSSFGGSQPHNNMPPYKAVYIWKRTA